ncbi:DUF6114 domain-containing protein [Streptomyces sp. Edi4]|uniref:DUF6114 domain-containing protein n=1 Tax=Streptomyces sp. Edi4 TaxID=3162527 RepID=UPI00330691ED
MLLRRRGLARRLAWGLPRGLPRFRRSGGQPGLTPHDEQAYAPVGGRARRRWLDERLPLVEARAALRAWRRTRPFWAGLLLVLGGLELLLVPLAPLTILLSLGLGGIAAIGIGIALVVAGLFLWLLPHTRHYVSINALILSVLSFAATNLGGFLAGMALGIAGSAMGFGWTPKKETAPTRRGTNPRTRRNSPRTQRTLAAALPVALLLTLGGHPVEQPRQGGAMGQPGQGSAARDAVVQESAVRDTAVRNTAAQDSAAQDAAAQDSAAQDAALRQLRRERSVRRPGQDGPVIAPAVPPTVTTARFSPHGFLLAGVTTVPTARGPLKVMVLRMTSASLTDYRLTTHDGHGELALGASSLDLSGRVTLYLSKFSGCLEGLLCLTFDPSTLPVPPVVPPFVFMTRVSAEQALVTSDSIVADGLTLGAS